MFVPQRAGVMPRIIRPVAGNCQISGGCERRDERAVIRWVHGFEQPFFFWSVCVREGSRLVKG